MNKLRGIRTSIKTRSTDMVVTATNTKIAHIGNNFFCTSFCSFHIFIWPLVVQNGNFRFICVIFDLLWLSTIEIMVSKLIFFRKVLKQSGRVCCASDVGRSLWGEISKFVVDFEYSVGFGASNESWPCSTAETSGRKPEERDRKGRSVETNQPRENFASQYGQWRKDRR